MAFNLRNRNFLKLLDFTPREIQHMLDLSAELKKLYPNDKATGFSKGDIRGAFSAIKILE